MTLDAVLAYLHFVSIFALGYALLGEWLELRRGAGALDVTRLARLDLLYMFAALATSPSNSVAKCSWPRECRRRGPPMPWWN